MNRRTMMFALSVLGIHLGACTECDHCVSRDAVTDGDTYDSLPETRQQEMNMVVAMPLFAPTVDGLRYGMNLDGVNSTVDDPFGCLHEDSVNPLEVLNTGDGIGIDNMFPDVDTVLGRTGLSGLITGWSRQINVNASAIALRISRIDSLEQDDDVVVNMYPALPLFGPPCSNAGSRAMFAPWDRGPSSTVTMHARIEGRRLIASSTRSQLLVIPVELAGGRTLNLPLRGITLRAMIASTTEVRSGNLGARINSAELVQALTRAGDREPGLALETATQVVVGLIDLQYPFTCSFVPGTDERGSGDISMGMGFSLVGATLTTMPVRTPVLGTCASQ